MSQSISAERDGDTESGSSSTRGRQTQSALAHVGAQPLMSNKLMFEVSLLPASPLDCPGFGGVQSLPKAELTKVFWEEEAGVVPTTPRNGSVPTAEPLINLLPELGVICHWFVIPSLPGDAGISQRVSLQPVKTVTDEQRRLGSDWKRLFFLGSSAALGVTLEVSLIPSLPSFPEQKGQGQTWMEPDNPGTHSEFSLCFMDETLT